MVRPQTPGGSRSRKRRVATILMVVVLLIQLLPLADRSNPRVTGDIAAPAPIAAILRRACYDCHSNETVWPWYAYVAPVSWWLAEHVEEGRGELNFSIWQGSSDEQRQHDLEEIAEEVEEGKMPPANYTWLHGDAQIDEIDREAIRAWVHASLGGKPGG